MNYVEDIKIDPSLTFKKLLSHDYTKTEAYALADRNNRLYMDMGHEVLVLQGAAYTVWSCCPTHKQIPLAAKLIGEKLYDNDKEMVKKLEEMATLMYQDVGSRDSNPGHSMYSIFVKQGQKRKKK